MGDSQKLIIGGSGRARPTSLLLGQPFVLLLLFLPSALLILYSAPAAASVEQGSALQELVSSGWITLKNPSWVAGSDPCVTNWTLVQCDTSGNIILLNLSHTALLGDIPSALGKLTTLITLDMGNNKNCKTCGHWNQVRGDLAALENLVNLQSLILTSNELSLDAFPSVLYKLNKLQNLRVDNTLIRGPFPEQLSTLPDLQYLYLGNNSFSGSLPGKVLGGMVTLVELTVWGNNFNCLTPPELGNLVNLTYLNINKCGLYGGLPPEYGNLTQLQKLLLYKNQLTGSIPDTWQGMANINDLELQANFLYGGVPAWLLEMPKLSIIRLSNNQLHGKISQLVLNRTTTPGLRNISFDCNYLSGSRPQSTNITTILEYNCWDNEPALDSACNRPLNCLNFQLATSNGKCPSCPENQHLFNSTTCICYADPRSSTKGFGTGALIGLVIGSILVAALGFLLCMVWLRNSKVNVKKKEVHSHPDFFNVGRDGSKERNGTQKDDYVSMRSSTVMEVPKGVQRFTIEELVKATNGFGKSNEIGEGGFGKVFVGNFPDGRTFAIKRAAPVNSTSQAGHEQFRNEVLLLSRLHHKNLVRLEGYCDEGEYQILVYEFMKNGNLDSLLHECHLGKNAGKYIMLDWYKRLEIAVHVAQGLDYLHSFADPPVIHRDVKPSNILLDDNLVAKVADFGISRESAEFDTHVSTRPAGTAGYFDPQYFLRRQLTTASDVYSFGVVLLELITGRKAINFATAVEEETNLIEWTKLKMAVPDCGVETVVDDKLEGNYPKKTYATLVGLALKCASFEKNTRPTMKAVVSVLEPLLQESERPSQDYTLQPWPSKSPRASRSYSPRDNTSSEKFEFTRIEMDTVILPR